MLPDEQKIVVDEDWKSRVQAEKEAATKAGQADHAPAQPASEVDAAAAQKSAPMGKAMPAPQASFPLLVTTLATQAVSAMGLTVDPVSRKPEPRLDWAKHFVDMLGLLEEVTKGNLSPQDEALLGNTLHDLRMAYVAIKSQQQK